jgi:hypothetical protein
MFGADIYLAFTLTLLTNWRFAFVCRYFEHRYRCLKRTAMIKCPEAMGCLTDHFDRCEFQHRGSCHMHGVGWSQHQCPLYDGTDATSAEICKYADQYISCAKEHPLVPPHIMKVQRHAHTGSCMKHGYCRFGYPRAPMKATVILTPIDETSGKLGGVSLAHMHVTDCRND